MSWRKRKPITLLVDAKSIRVTSIGAVNSTDHWVERSVTVTAPNAATEIQGAPETPSVEDGHDVDDDESETLILSIRGIPPDPDRRNRRIYLALLVATALAICLFGSFILTQGRNLGLATITATWVSLGIFTIAAILLLAGLLLILPHRLDKKQPAADRRQLILERMAHANKVDARLYVISNVIFIFVFILGFAVITGGTLVVILSNNNSTGLTISVVAGAATALTIYYRATFKSYHRIVVDRYSTSTKLPDRSPRKEAAK